MPRPRKTTPQYLRPMDKPIAARVTSGRMSTANGTSKFSPARFNSPESTKAFARLLLELQVAPQAAPAAKKNGDLLLVEMLDAYRQHAEKHYRTPDGKPTSEFGVIKPVLRSLDDTYGDESAAEFGPLKLKALRQKWVVENVPRGEVNRRTNIVRRIFKWAASEELVHETTYNALRVVSGLQKGRTAARETDPVLPVDDVIVDATLPFLNRFVVALVQFQRLTGCRPGEACALRMTDVDTAGDVWMFRPKEHKTAHKGKGRAIAIGPKAQAVIAPFIGTDPTAYVFDPRAAVEEGRADRAANRKTPLYPSAV